MFFHLKTLHNIIYPTVLSRFVECIFVVFSFVCLSLIGNCVHNVITGLNSRHYCVFTVKVFTQWLRNSSFYSCSSIFATQISHILHSYRLFLKHTILAETCPPPSQQSALFINFCSDCIKFNLKSWSFYHSEHFQSNYYFPFYHCTHWFKRSADFLVC